MDLKKRRTVIIAGAVVALAIGSGFALAGSGEPVPTAQVQVTTTTATTTTTLPSSKTAEAPPPSTKTVTETVKVSTEPVLDHFGLGKVKLGMKLEQLKSGGLITTTHGAASDTCTDYFLKSGGLSVGVNPERGVVSISLGAGGRTQEGIRVGSTIEELRAAYPGAEQGPNGFAIKLADNANAHYFITKDVTGKVSHVTLNLHRHGCFN